MYQYLRHINSNKQAPLWLGASFTISQPKVDLNEGRPESEV